MTLGQDGQTYYKLYSSKTNWWNAEDACTGWGLDGLAPFNTEAMIRNVYGLLGHGSFNQDTFIDVRNKDKIGCYSKSECNLRIYDRDENRITTNLAYVTHEFKIDSNYKSCIKFKKNSGKMEDESCLGEKYPMCYQVCAPAVTCDGSAAPTLANSDDDNSWSTASPANEGDVIT